MNQAASLSEPPMKRRRGRPRKEETYSAQSAEKPSPPSRPTLRLQGEASDTLWKGKETVHVEADDQSADDDYSDEMIGQVVTGVLECAFDAGYMLRVRVGNSNMYMRGVVFKQGCVVPVTHENDIAPNVKMYTRRDLPIPDSFTPENVFQKDKNKENVEILSNVALEKERGIVEGDEVEKEKDLDASTAAQNGDQVVPREENVTYQPEEEKTENQPSAEPAHNGNEVVSEEVIIANELEEGNMETEPSTDVKEKGLSSERADLEDQSEPLEKTQKTNEIIVTEICGSGFQISTENTEVDGLLTEPPSEFNAMEIEPVQE